MAVFPVEDDICEKKASDFLWEALKFFYLHIYLLHIIMRWRGVGSTMVIDLNVGCRLMYTLCIQMWAHAVCILFPNQLVCPLPVHVELEQICVQYDQNWKYLVHGTQAGTSRNRLFHTVQTCSVSQWDHCGLRSIIFLPCLSQRRPKMITVLRREWLITVPILLIYVYFAPW